VRVTNVRFSVLASARSTSMEKSIWNTPPLPKPPRARSAWIWASERAALGAPETSSRKKAPAEKYELAPPAGAPASLRGGVAASADGEAPVPASSSACPVPSS
jgi:hypothetical protein